MHYFRQHNWLCGWCRNTSQALIAAMHSIYVGAPETITGETTSAQYCRPRRQWHAEVWSKDTRKTCLIAVWRHSCTMSSIGWTYQKGSHASWASWCTVVCMDRHLGTSPTISLQPLQSLHGFVCVAQTDISSSYLAVDSNVRLFDCWTVSLELVVT